MGAARERTRGTARGCDAAPLLHRQGRRGQDLDRLRHGGRPVRPGQAGAAGEHRPRVQPERRAGNHRAAAPHRRRGRPRSHRLQPRSCRGRGRLSRARGRTLPGRPAGRLRGRHRGATVGCLHRRDRRLRRVLAPPGRPGGDRRLRPRGIRHRSHRPHAAAAFTSDRLDRLPDHQLHGRRPAWVPWQVWRVSAASTRPPWRRSPTPS